MQGPYLIYHVAFCVIRAAEPYIATHHYDEPETE